MIRFEHISKIYQVGDDEIRAADDVSFNISKGEFVAIVGQSGSGKSTCMNIIGCLDVPTLGSKLAELRNKTLGFIFQQYNLIPKLTVAENVEMPLLYGGYSNQERRAAALESLRRVGLEHKANSFPPQLSGGQQQRVSIARALVSNPSVILADEPTGALDSRTGREVLEFLQELNSEGNTIVLITHDNSIARKAHRIIRLFDGKIIYDGPADSDQAVVNPDIPHGEHIKKEENNI